MQREGQWSDGDENELWTIVRAVKMAWGHPVNPYKTYGLGLKYTDVFRIFMFY
jgi:hypothetical protein